MMHRCGQEVEDVRAHECPGRVVPAGHTLAEAVGLQIPSDAPGGARIAPAASYTPHRAAERASRRGDLGYDGFVDLDAWS